MDDFFYIYLPTQIKIIECFWLAVYMRHPLFMLFGTQPPCGEAWAGMLDDAHAPLFQLIIKFVIGLLILQPQSSFSSGQKNHSAQQQNLKNFFKALFF